MRWYWFKTYLRRIALSVGGSLRNRWTSRSSAFVVASHVGLGDQILLAGLIKHYLGLGKSITWFVRESNVETVRSLTNHHENLQIIPIPSSSSADEALRKAKEFGTAQDLPILLIGFEILWLAEKLFPARGLDEVFYIIGGVDFSKSVFECSRVPPQINPPSTPYALVDHFPGTNREIPHSVFESLEQRGLRIILNPREEPILTMLDLVKMASEIHVVNSALLCLVISLRREINCANVYLMGPNTLIGKSEYPLKWRELSLTTSNGDRVSIPLERDRVTELGILLKKEREFKRRLLAKIIFRIPVAKHTSVDSRRLN